MQDIELESEDLHAALEELHQYIDITEEDLKKIYSIALAHAKERLTLKVPVKYVMTRNVIYTNKDTDVHEAPPGGATTLIAVIGGEKIHNLGFLYAFVPAGMGAVIILVIALFVNNLAKDRKYPEYWL